MNLYSFRLFILFIIYVICFTENNFNKKKGGNELETQTEVGLKSILEKYYENLENLEKILPKKEFRKAFAILTVRNLMEIYNSKGIKYNRTDLMRKCNFLLEQNNLEKYSYFFYRQFA